MELFKIADGREFFYQWDLDRKILVFDPDITEVHFCNGTSDCSLVVKVEDGAANVPNVLLQIARNIRIFAVMENRTCAERIFMVKPRTKPADYVYTETEVKRYEDLEKLIEDVRKSIPAVPVQSVNGKTGAVQLTASDVGALPKDTPIPSPYTLPTASENTKGGVMVGSGLMMEGEMLSIKPEEELIAHIVVESDGGVGIIKIDKDINGNDFELTYAKFRYRAPEQTIVGETGSNVGVGNNAWYSSNTNRILTFAMGSPKYGEIAIGYGEVYLTDDGIYGHAGVAKGLNLQLNEIYSETKNKDKLKCFYIFATTNAHPILKGTEIIITGKRKER